jgi:hypothetical protein
VAHGAARRPAHGRGSQSAGPRARWTRSPWAPSAVSHCC